MGTLLHATTEPRTSEARERTAAPVAPRWPLALAVSAFAVCAGLVTQSAIAAADGRIIYALDDAYIHMAMAKNLALNGVWGCTPFHFSSSSSSLLWTSVLAATDAVTGVRDLTPLILNGVFAVLTLVIVDYYLVRWSVPPLTRIVALSGVAVAPAMLGLVLMGMEHVLHLALTIWFAAAAAQSLRFDQSRARAPAQELGLLCLLAGFLSASRYEGVFLVALVCLAFATRHRLRDAVAIGAAASLPIVVFGLMSVWLGAFFFPNSLLLKAGGESASAWSVLFKPVAEQDAAFYRNSPGLLLLVAFGLVAGLTQALRRRTPWQPDVLLPVWLATTIVLHGHFVFSSTYWAYRYDAYLMGFGVFAAAVALSPRGETHRAKDRLRSWIHATALGALIVAVTVVGPTRLPRAEIATVRNTLLEHYTTAQFVKAFYPRDVVVVNDLGAVSYFTNARILDLVGLGDDEPLRILRASGHYTRDDVYRWTSQHHPAIAIIQLDWNFAVSRVPPEWTRVAEVRVPTYGQRIGFFAVDPTAASLLRANVEYFYSTEWSGHGYRVALF